jgi:hypothetical protein
LELAGYHVVKAGGSLGIFALVALGPAGGAGAAGGGGGTMGTAWKNAERQAARALGGLCNTSGEDFS